MHYYNYYHNIYKDLRTKIESNDGYNTTRHASAYTRKLLPQVLAAGGDDTSVSRCVPCHTAGFNKVFIFSIDVICNGFLGGYRRQSDDHNLYMNQEPE